MRIIFLINCKVFSCARMRSYSSIFKLFRTACAQNEPNSIENDKVNKKSEMRLSHKVIRHKIYNLWTFLSVNARAIVNVI